MNVEIRHSTIQGRGVFAVEKIEVEQWQYAYGFYPLAENKYCFDREGKNWEPYPPFNCLNHSNTPNCEVHEVDGVMIVEAIRDIEVNEELTIHYGHDPGEDDGINRV